MTEAGMTQRIISYLGRRIELVLPVVLSFSVTCLTFGAIAQRIDVANLALMWVPVITGALSALTAIIFVAYLVVVKPELLKRVKIVYWERIIPGEPEPAILRTNASGGQ
jgi:hypothetical protein